MTGYFAPTARFGPPDDFRAFVDRLHQAGIGVILDWVPAHFPKDDWALARFDGTALYEHDDPRRGEHPDWGTLVFNFGRNEVRNFLLASALHWLREYHADGLRVDAVASMLYLDYSRKAGEWVPNVYGGNEDLDAIAFLKQLNEVAHGREPGVLMAAEESTAWPGVSRPVYLGGLGFGLKWNMGWMHDTLAYFQRDPVYRRYPPPPAHLQPRLRVLARTSCCRSRTTRSCTARARCSRRCPATAWQQLANLRALYALHVGAPRQEAAVHGRRARRRRASGRSDGSLDWHLLERPEHAGIQSLVRDLNLHYRDEPALWEVDFEPAGFRWLEPNDAAGNVLAFMRLSTDGKRQLVCACNFSPVPRHGLPDRAAARAAGGASSSTPTPSSTAASGVGNLGGVTAEEKPWHDQPCSAEVTLPPLGVVWLVPEG